MYKYSGTMLKAALMLALIRTAATHTESFGNVATCFGQFDKVIAPLLPVLLTYT